MDLTADFLSGLTDLTKKAQAVQQFEIDGRKYTDKMLSAVMEPLPIVLKVDTLTAIKDYLLLNPDGLKKEAVLIIVDSPSCVRVLSNLFGPFLQRSTYLAAEPSRLHFPFGQYMAVENFIIGLQAQFNPSDTIAGMLALVGNLRDGLVREYGDDGISQTVTAKVGITKVENIKVPNPVTLAPFRTFMEVKQPESRFIFRMRSGAAGGEMPTCALFEADGGAWMLDAMSNIKFWLKDNLAEFTILA